MEEKFNFRQKRLKLGLTQVELAKELSVTAEYLSMIENGKKELSLKLKSKFMLLLNKHKQDFRPVETFNNVELLSSYLSMVQAQVSVALHSIKAGEVDVASMVDMAKTQLDKASHYADLVSDKGCID